MREHRYGLHGWFVAGALVPFLTAVLMPLLAGRVWTDLPSHSVVLVGVSGVLSVLILRLLAGGLTVLLFRRDRPHTLFTPLYDQR